MPDSGSAGSVADLIARGDCMPYRSHRLSLCLPALIGLCLWVLPCSARSPQDERQEAMAAIPYSKLTPAASATIRQIVERPTIYRRLPQQVIQCDPSMFVFLVRHPDVIVGIWQRMEVSKVETQRVGPYQFLADDNAGTKCTIDLIYGDSRTHVFVAKGLYDGPMTPKPISGSGVFILRSDYAGDEKTGQVQGTLDCFLQLDSLGADLIARTLSNLIGKTADQNFVETAKFMSQVSQASAKNPTAMRDLALDLPIEAPTCEAFARAIVDLATRQGNLYGSTQNRALPFIAQQPDAEETSSR